MRHRNLKFVFALSVLTYIGLTFLLPPDPQTLDRFDISVLVLRLLSVSIAVPLVVIWLAAFYGYARLHEYGEKIADTKEGVAVRTLSQGVLILVIALPLNAVLNTLLRYASRTEPGLATASTVIGNYIELALPLAGFVLISIGARQLTELSRQRVPRRAAHMLIILFSVIGVMYTYFVVHFAYTGNGNASEAYAMPIWLALLTLVVPYTYMWYIGLVAAYELFLYNTGLKGVLYRKSWSRFSAGIGLVVLSSILVQYVSTLSTQLNRLTVTSLLLVIYVLLLVMAAGYMLMAYGAKRLQKIEEV